MSFKVNDKVRVISLYRESGNISLNYKDGTYLVKFEKSGRESGFFEAELELVDEKAEALIELAETLDKARMMANAIEETAPQGGTYGKIVSSLKETLAIYFEVQDLPRSNGYLVYQSMLENGDSVREAIAAVSK